MKVELKDYGIIGYPRKLNLKIISTTLNNLENNTNWNEEILWEGLSEDIPSDISNLHYYKIELGNPTIYYIIKQF